MPHIIIIKPVMPIKILIINGIVPDVSSSEEKYLPFS